MNTYELLNLYPHNIKTCEKVREAFESGQDIVSIIKATGTGKSYIGLNLALEHKDEKIIWLVPTNAIKEHIEKIINSNPNLSMERDFPNLEIRTYSSLVDMTDEELEDIPCDLLIVDELHHIGAPVWGERVNTIVDTHTGMKTFGMSAYSVRDRGTSYERDMTNPETEEIFSNTVVDRYDLYDAIIDGVLPLPVSKAILTEDSPIFEELEDALKVKKLTKKEIQKEIETTIDAVLKTIHSHEPVKEVIQETVTENGKYIYFCPVYSYEGINDMDTIIEKVVGDIREKYPDKRIVVYKTTSAMGTEGDKNRDCFYHDVDLEGRDASNTIRIMFAKNQYNEGVHAPNVTGVFMGRKTGSDIVALEQIGRALSVRQDVKKMRAKYNLLELDDLKGMAKSRGLIINENITKEYLIELLVSPTIIDLTGNLEFLEELETNLKDRVRERRKEGTITRERADLLETYSPFMLDEDNKNLLKALLNLKNQVYQSSWDDYYELAIAYFKEHGDSEIPRNFKTKDGITESIDEDAVNLGFWCNTQRNSFKNKTLSNDRIEKLKLINFRLETNYWDLEWEKMYNLVKAYYQEHGTSEISSDFKTREGVVLETWCDNQRQFFKKGKLSEDRIKKLELIEFRFETNYWDLEWEKMYNLAKNYYQEHGNSEIHTKFKTREGIALGIWCDNQRKFFKKGKLSEDRIKKLKLIEFRFEDLNDIEWEKNYALAKAYYDAHENSEISNKFKTKDGITKSTDKDAVAIGEWCNRQRQNFKNKTLSEDRIKKLELIKFRFEELEELEWNKNYDLVVLYYQHCGHSNVPHLYKTKNGITKSTDKDAVAIGEWCNRQRQNFKNKTLSEERIKKLKLINFIFEDIFELEWERMYNLAKAYYYEYGNSEIPTSFKTQEGDNLGNWCNTQRQNFKKKKLSEDRIKKLELIEFRFKTKKDVTEEKIELCNTYGIDFNKYKILDKMSYQELYAKIMFLLDNNLPLETDGKLHPIFTMCNENMMINYGISKEELITNYYINRKGRK